MTHCRAKHEVRNKSDALMNNFDTSLSCLNFFFYVFLVSPRMSPPPWITGTSYWFLEVSFHYCFASSDILLLSCASYSSCATVNSLGSNLPASKLSWSLNSQAIQCLSIPMVRDQMVRVEDERVAIHGEEDRGWLWCIYILLKLVLTLASS